MKLKLFNNEPPEGSAPSETSKYYKGIDALQRAQIILDSMKASMVEFSTELDAVVRQAGK